jgi:hypothetical protein
VDPSYLNGYPKGQIEITIYSKDADTLDSWVTKHTGPQLSREKTRYWSPVTNRATLTVAGRDGLSFDWVPDAASVTIHATAVFLSTVYVLTVSWWSYDATYGTTLDQYRRQMLADLQM